MKIFNQWKLARWLLIILFVVIIVSILYLPLWLSFLTLPEQIFILSLIVFLIVYSNVIAGYLVLNTLLSKIDNDENIEDLVQEHLSKEDFIKLILEGELLFVVESMLFKLKERTSILFNISLLFMFWFFILYNVGVIIEPIFYSIIVPILVVTFLVWGIESVVSLKFIRVFSEELIKLKEILVNLEDELKENENLKQNEVWNMEKNEVNNK